MNHFLRAIRAPFLLSLGLAVLSQPATAGAPHGTVSPLLIVGPQATLALTPAGVSAPQYGLFTCQLVGLSPGVTCYDPYQMRHAYQIDQLIAGGHDGTGHTIVIVDAFQSPNIVQQLNHNDTFYGLPGLNGLGSPPNPNIGTFTQVAPDGLTPFVPGDPIMTGWAEEISLDVLWAHAIAPGANITLVLAKSNSDPDILSALTYAVDNSLGDVISMSFGENESCVGPDPATNAAYHAVFAAATLKHITLFASSGDQGAAQPTCDGSSWVQVVSSPASDPLVTGVGGTELHAARYCLTALGCDPSTNPAPGTYQGEIVWNEFSSSSSSGGGFSVLFDEPPYQKGTGGLHGGKQRAVPDVAYNAAVLHGVLTYLNIPGVPVGTYLFGGTSAGSPQWAAITAIANQVAGGQLGFLNSAIYKTGQAKSKYSASFNDITSGNNSVVEFDTSGNPVAITGFTAGTGWDATTGNGSPVDLGLTSDLIGLVSPGDGNAVVNNTKPKSNPKPIVPGSKDPH
jgi:subtilase family serine protease